MPTTDTSPEAPVFVPLEAGAVPRPPCADARPLLDPVLRPGTLTLIRGESGLGKSWLALSLARAVASGGAVLDWTAPQPTCVLYVDGALSPCLLADRIAALRKAPADRLQLLATATHGQLPDLGTTAGIEALERAMPSDLALLVLDDLTTLLRPGRGHGERLRVFTDWLLSLRRRGLAVLLLDGPRRVATALLDAYADTKLALVRPSDWREEDGARFQVRLTARGFTGAAVRRFEARLDLKDGHALWTRLAPHDDAALMAWRLYAEQRLSTRAIGRELGVSRATAWRLLRRARALPEELRQQAAPEPLPGVEEAARRAEEKLARDPGLRREIAWPEAHEGMEVVHAATAVLLEAQHEEVEAAKHPLDTPEVHAFLQAVLRDKPPEAVKPPATPAAAPSGEAVKHAATPAPAPTREAVKQPTASPPASSGEALKQEATPRIEDLPTERLMELLLARRRAYQAGRMPAPDELSAIAYHGLVCHARTRLGTRTLNQRLAEEDAAHRPAAPRRPRGFDVKHLPYPPHGGY